MSGPVLDLLSRFLVCFGPTGFDPLIPGENQKSTLLDFDLENSVILGSGTLSKNENSNFWFADLELFWATRILQKKYFIKNKIKDS